MSNAQRTTSDHAGSDHPGSDHAGPDHAGIGLGLRWSFLEDVLDADELELDFFEISPENYMRRGGYFPEALHEVAQLYPLRTHGLMMNLGGPKGPSEAYLNALDGFLKEVGVKAHSDHLCWSGTQDQILHDLLPLALHKQSARRVADQIRRAQDRLGLPLAVENISYYGHLGPGNAFAEADFICTVLELADCALLLDVNNVWVNAQNHGFDPVKYLAHLPLDRVVEMHVAGAEVLPHMHNLWIDTHGADVHDKTVELMQWVLRRTGPLPVLYERDHTIPPLSKLMLQVAQLKKAYLAAVATKPELKARERVHTEIPDRIDQAQVLLSRAILDPSRPSAVPMEDKIVDVYRQLVNNGLRGVCRQFLPRCAKRRGQAFDQDLDAWLAGPGPRSHFLRDLPFEFFRFIEATWIEDSTCPAYLPDLARHELIEFCVESSPEREPKLAEHDVSLDDALVFAGTARVLTYDFAVHRLPEDPQDTSLPEPQRTALLAYRDQDHEVRYLELSDMAKGLCARLLEGHPLGQAVLAQATQDGCLRSDGQVQDSYLSRVLGLLEELSSKGALLGPAQAAPHSHKARPFQSIR